MEWPWVSRADYIRLWHERENTVHDLTARAEQAEARAEKERERYDALVTRVLTLERGKATVAPPPVPTEVVAARRAQEQAMRKLASDLRAENPALSESDALAAAKRLRKEALGEPSEEG